MKVFTYIKRNSSRVPKKNFLNLGNLPLWKHLIYELSDISDIFIDTDSYEIIKECETDFRLSSVTAYSRFLNTFVEDDNEIIVLTHVTSPFLKASTVLDAVSHLSSGHDAVHSVTSKQDFAWLESFDNPLNFDPKVVQRTQDLDKIYFSNGAFFIFTKKTFIKNRNRFGHDNLLYTISNIEGLEIDNKEDFEMAKILYRGVKNENGFD